MTLRPLAQQRGFGFTQIIFGTIVVVFGLWLGMKIVPPLYLHMKVQKVLDNMALEGKFSSDSEIRSSFIKRLDSSYLEGDVAAEDLTITPSDDGYLLTVVIDKESPLFGGVGIRVYKEATVTLN